MPGFPCPEGQLVSDVQPGYLGLSGGEDLGNTNEAAAKARFAKLVLETKRKREEQFGFELDAADVQPALNNLPSKIAIVRRRKSVQCDTPSIDRVAFIHTAVM